MQISPATALAYVYCLNLSAAVAAYSTIDNWLGGRDTKNADAGPGLLMRNFPDVEDPLFAGGLNDQIHARGILYEKEIHLRDLNDKVVRRYLDLGYS